jgi:hemerythrin-like metal-binding protein
MSLQHRPGKFGFEHLKEHFMSTGLSLVTWSDEFNLGMDEIDAQHRVLIDLINDVWVAVVKKPDRDEALRVLEELEKYTITHFTAEEIFMREIGYQNFDQHKEEHTKFVARVAEEKAKVVAGGPVTLGIIHFLKDWLINHILVADKEYALEYKKRSEPTSVLGKFFKRLWA